MCSKFENISIKSVKLNIFRKKIMRSNVSFKIKTFHEIKHKVIPLIVNIFLIIKIINKFLFRKIMN